MKRWWGFLWIAAIFALYALHILHPTADFPNYSPWMDYAKYTDEGWYGNAAIEHFIRGSWYVPGDFNPAAALPVWPLLEGLVFVFTGVSLAAARLLVIAVFGGNLLLAYALVRSQEPDGERRWVALLATTMIASSAFLYCFGRLAILEPLLLFWTMLSWLLLLRFVPRPESPRRTLALAAAGLLYCLAILTKTTAVFLLPSLIYLLWYPQRGRMGSFLRSALTVAAAAAIPWAAYFFLFVRPRYLLDYQYLFRVNVYVRPTSLGGWMATFWHAFYAIFWIDRTLVWVAFAIAALSLVYLRTLWRNPLFVASLLAIAGYWFFVGYQNNMQPRYYAVAAFPLLFVVSMGTAALLRRQRLAGRCALAAIVAAIGWNLWIVQGYVRYPEYTFVNAARNLTRYIDQHSDGNRLLLSISGNQISLVTGLPSICDDFGTLDLPARIRRYQPGWYAEWNEMDAGTLADIHTWARLEKVAVFKAFDDDDRDTLYLYRIHPLPPELQREDDDPAGDRITDLPDAPGVK